MYLKSVTLQQCNFCDMLRFLIISIVHGPFSFSIKLHAQNIGIKKFLLRKQKFFRKLRKFQCWAKIIFQSQKRVVLDKFVVPVYAMKLKKTLRNFCLMKFVKFLSGEESSNFLLSFSW